jgi:hypothetical protein
VRRVLSVILLVLGGWFLTTEVMMAWMRLEEGTGGQWIVLAVMAGLAAPLLLLGMWASPGNRFADLGLTLMIAAGVGGVVALTTAMALNDPGFKQLMPPGKPAPDLHLAPVIGSLNLLVVAGGGYLLWRFGRLNPRRPEPDLEQIFGDD